MDGRTTEQAGVNLRYWNLLTFDSVASLPPSEQFCAFALAYLDSAERLCQTLARSHRKATYARGSVVLYLAAHSVELFLKGAILDQKPKEHFGHNLKNLYDRYNKLYPAKKYRFKLPFDIGCDGLPKSEIIVAKSVSPPTDQLYRYPQDKDGKPWPGLFAFEANSFLEVLHSLRADFERILKQFGKQGC